PPSEAGVSAFFCSSGFYASRNRACGWPLQGGRNFAFEVRRLAAALPFPFRGKGIALRFNGPLSKGLCTRVGPCSGGFTPPSFYTSILGYVFLTVSGLIPRPLLPC